jgi:hypothetical protein
MVGTVLSAIWFILAMSVVYKDALWMGSPWWAPVCALSFISCVTMVAILGGLGLVLAGGIRIPSFIVVACVCAMGVLCGVGVWLAANDGVNSKPNCSRHFEN